MRYLRKGDPKETWNLCCTSRVCSDLNWSPIWKKNKACSALHAKLIENNQNVLKVTQESYHEWILIVSQNGVDNSKSYWKAQKRTQFWKQQCTRRKSCTHVFVECRACSRWNTSHLRIALWLYPTTAFEQRLVFFFLLWGPFKLRKTSLRRYHIPWHIDHWN